MTAITYTEVKEALADEAFPTSEGSAWQGQDQASYDQFAAGATYSAGVPFSIHQANYGFAYPSLMPAAISNAVGSEDYSATSLAGTPLTGAHASTPVTWTLTEVNGPATSYEWALGDGTHQATTVPTITYTYSAAGTFTASVVPTIDGVVKPTVTASAPAVLT